jgi:hypothetical protein
MDEPNLYWKLTFISTWILCWDLMISAKSLYFITLFPSNHPYLNFCFLFQMHDINENVCLKVILLFHGRYSAICFKKRDEFEVKRFQMKKSSFKLWAILLETFSPTLLTTPLPSCKPETLICRPWISLSTKKSLLLQKFKELKEGRSLWNGKGKNLIKFNSLNLKGFMQSYEQEH